ncbi:HpcH/HpaI aldolase/citrate lyase family protein [Streptomyces sp. SP18CS02]|uniref:HpcH/HpaI aldolase/citrate lyase family protein n=1 Tax=Streptomyces sp. SP18CS02 TaxID=3002531 RepID=UPI002E78B336|nr:CoA ester lyase [Streptomyces sp. SP18CS02]MEE1754445.1 CoA ester lyase [Streptomyces sp. SP18CS02]
MKPQVTLLFVPGDRPERFLKAAACDAGGVLVDLEDAVAPEGKARARDAAVAWLAAHDGYLRINAVDTPWYDEDMAALAAARRLRGVVLPKSATADQVAGTVRGLPAGVPLLALVESALGVREAAAIAGLSGVARLLFGSIDFALDAGITPSEPDEPELLWARSALVVASKAAGLPAPLDGVYTRLEDEAGLMASSRRSRQLGFGGRLCVHPRQVEPVHRAWRPTEAERDWARRVVAAAGESGGAAVRVDGQMIDRPRLELARSLLSR